jgi:hypothetical protein
MKSISIIASLGWQAKHRLRQKQHQMSSAFSFIFKIWFLWSHPFAQTLTHKPTALIYSGLNDIIANFSFQSCDRFSINGRLSHGIKTIAFCRKTEKNEFAGGGQSLRIFSLINLPFSFKLVIRPRNNNTHTSATRIPLTALKFDRINLIAGILPQSVTTQKGRTNIHRHGLLRYVKWL